MQISKAKLQEALEIVKPGLASKEVIEQATSFAFVNGRVVTYNDEISISHPVEGLEITGAVKAEMLYQFLGKIKKDEIDISITESEILIKAGKAKAGITLQNTITLPLESLAIPTKWKMLPDNFIDRMLFVIGSAGKDMSRPVLTCVHVNKEGYIEACDALRVSKTIIDPMPIKTFLIPATSCITVCKLQPIKIAEGSGWIHFQTAEGSVISCRIFEDDSYPNTSALYVVKGENVELPKKLGDVLTRAAIFAKRDHIFDESIDISVTANKLKIKAVSDSGAGWFEESLLMEYAGKDLNFSVPPYTLKDIIKETSSCIVSEFKMKFEGENWVYITSLAAAK